MQKAREHVRVIHRRSQRLLLHQREKIRPPRADAKLSEHGPASDNLLPGFRIPGTRLRAITVKKSAIAVFRQCRFSHILRRDSIASVAEDSYSEPEEICTAPFRRAQATNPSGALWTP